MGVILTIRIIMPVIGIIHPYTIDGPLTRNFSFAKRKSTFQIKRIQEMGMARGRCNARRYGCDLRTVVIGVVVPVVKNM